MNNEKIEKALDNIEDSLKKEGSIKIPEMVDKINSEDLTKEEKIFLGLFIGKIHGGNNGK